MFGKIFSRSSTTDKVPDVAKSVETESSKLPYTVGVNNDGSTVLTFNYQGSYTSLTMNHAAVRQLIRMLEATLAETSEPEDESLT